MSIVVGVALFGGVFLLPVFLQNLMGYDAIQTGLLMMPQGLALATVMPVANILMRKFDPRVPMTIGMILLSVSLFLQAGMTTDTNTFDLLFWTALRGWGLGLTFPAMNQTSLGAVPIQKIGQASGLFNVTRQLGGSFGIAALSTLLTQRTVFHQAILGQDAAHVNMAGAAIGQFQQMYMQAGSSASVAAMQADYQLFTQLDELLGLVRQVLERLEDTQMLAGSEAYVAALSAYKLFTAAADAGIAGADAIADSLRQRFVSSASPAGGPTP